MLKCKDKDFTIVDLYAVYGFTFIHATMIYDGMIRL